MKHKIKNMLKSTKNDVFLFLFFFSSTRDRVYFETFVKQNGVECVLQLVAMGGERCTGILDA